jgi:hypothetical protein
VDAPAFTESPLKYRPVYSLYLTFIRTVSGAFLWHLFRRRQRATRLAVHWLLVTGFGSLLIAALAPLAGLQGELLAGAFWSQAGWSLFTAVIVLPLLLWSRRSAHTLTR